MDDVDPDRTTVADHSDRRGREIEIAEHPERPATKDGCGGNIPRRRPRHEPAHLAEPVRTARQIAENVQRVRARRTESGAHADCTGVRRQHPATMTDRFVAAPAVAHVRIDGGDSRVAEPQVALRSPVGARRAVARPGRRRLVRQIARGRHHERGMLRRHGGTGTLGHDIHAGHPPVPVDPLQLAVTERPARRPRHAGTDIPRVARIRFGPLELRPVRGKHGRPIPRVDPRTCHPRASTRLLPPNRRRPGPHDQRNDNTGHQHRAPEPPPTFPPPSLRQNTSTPFDRTHR